MTDRELLEAAAKAYGLIEHRYADGVGMMAAYTPQDGFHGPWWSSLEDDGDALRLAVKLHLTLRLYMGHACAQTTVPGGPSVYIDETDPLNPAKAARRAVTRAAAAMVASEAVVLPNIEAKRGAVGDSA